MRRVVAAAICLLMVGFAAAGPCSARVNAAHWGEYPGIPYVGDRLNLFDPPGEMAADTPFAVAHGNCNPPEGGRVPVLRPGTRFELYVDGVPVRMGTLIELQAAPDCPFVKVNYHNFRVGLPAGLHAFEGIWFDGTLGEYLRIEVQVAFS